MPEILDLIDEKDNVIGTATREECHNNPELLHRTVHFTLIDKKTGKVLLTQRSFKKKHDAGKFCFLGEHILSGENYERAIMRGVHEEAGFIPSKSIELAHNLFTYQKERELVRFFVVEWNGEKLHFAEDEVEQFLWVSIAELKKNSLDISEMTKFWIVNADWLSA